MQKVVTVLLLGMAISAACAEPPLVLENQALRLSFDAHTGAWQGLVDRRDGAEFVAGSPVHACVAPARAMKLDVRRVAAAVAAGDAVSLTNGWLYTPKAVGHEGTTNLPAGRFDTVKWDATSIPSRRGAGDDRLHNRFGDFWYRCEFTTPANWPAGDLALVIGAVDDFDVTWVNGTRIGSTGVETPHHWETPRFYRFPARLLRPGQSNTLLIKVTNGGFDGGIDGPVVVGPVARLSPPEIAAPPLTRHERDGGVLRLAAREGDYEYQAEFALAGDQPLFTRQLTVKNISAKEQLYQTANYISPPLSVGPGQSVIFPGSLPVGDNLASDLFTGDSLRPRTRDPLVVLWDAAQRRGLGSWFYSEDEYAPVTARRADAGVEIQHTQNVIIRLKPGESVALGKQYFWLAHGVRDAALRGVQDVYQAIHLRAPAHGLAGLGGMVMYCGHPGGPPELGFLRYGGFKAIQAYVPVLRKLHIDLLWFLPIWDHGDDRKWNLYAPFDHFQVDHLLGTAEELKQLSRECAAGGMHLMFDLVPHGPPDFTPLAKDHPEWIARKQDGSLQYAWGQVAFDNHHPGCQEYFRGVVAWGAKEFGAVGARVDCGAGGPLNWNPQISNRPSLSSLAGGLGINRAIRGGYLRARSDVVLLPEEYTGANIFYRVSDLTYDAQFYYLQGDLLARNAPPEEWAREFQQFLHDQQQTLPPGGLKMRWISNHDTVSWTFQKQRPAKAYGVERMRALLAMCAFIEGVPMLYQGDEDPAVYGGKGESSIDFLARIYGLRKELPALREGSADYTSAQATGGVFACLRQSQGQTALVLISFNPAPMDSMVTLPGNLPRSWKDRLSDERIASAGGLRVKMGAYQVRVLTALH